MARNGTGDQWFSGSVTLYRQGQCEDEPWRNHNTKDMYNCGGFGTSHATLTDLVNALLGAATLDGANYCHAEINHLEAYCGRCNGHGRLHDKSRQGRKCDACNGVGHWAI